MKSIIASFMFIVFAYSQVYAQVDDSLRYAESVWSMEKKAMIVKQMDLTEAEKSAFWPIYESYSNAIQYIDIEYIRLLTLRDEDLSDKQATSLTEHMLMNELLLAKARKQYFRKFRKALTPALASRFMQLDNDFRTMLRIQMQKESPAVVSSLNRLYLRN
jgi:hypothetical protein